MNTLVSTILASSVNFAQIVDILNYSLIGLFVLIIVGLVFAILGGIFRGFFSMTFRLAFIGILITIAICLLPQTVDAVGSFDIAKFARDFNLNFNMFVNVSNAETGQTLSVPITTLRNTIQNSLLAFMKVNNVSGSTTEIINTSTELTTMFLSYSVLFIDMLLISTLGLFLCWLLWICLFKRLIPVMTRKKVKIRWLAGIEGGVHFLVIGALFLAPLSSMVNIANQSWQKYGQNSQDESIQGINSFLDTYNDSLVAKTFFNWTTNEDGLTLDSQFMDYVTKTMVGDVATSFTSTLSSLTDVGALLASSLVDFSKGGPLNVGFLLGEKTLTSIFESINKSQIFTYVLPLVATIAVNSDALKTFIDPSLLELDDIDWDKEVNNTQTLLLDLSKSGILNLYLNENGEPITPDQQSEEGRKLIKDSLLKLLDANSFKYFSRIYTSIDNSKLLSRLIPATLFTISDSQPEIMSFLPKTWDEMKALKWGQEINILYSNICLLNNRAPKLLDSYVDLLLEPVNKDTTVLSSKSYEDKYNTFKEELTNHMDDLISFIVGDFDSNGRLMFDENGDGYTDIFDVTGNRLHNRHYSLFDSNLFLSSISFIEESIVGAFENIPNMGMDGELIRKALDELNNGLMVKNYKLEFGTLLHVYKNAMQNDTILQFVQGTAPENVMDTFANEEIVNEIVRILPSFDKSIIFKTALIPALQEQLKINIVNEENNNQTFSSIGIDVNKINFKVDNFIGEISAFLKVMPKVNKLQYNLSINSDDQAALFDSLSNNVGDVASVLDTIFDSQIFNDKDTFENDENNNFFGVLKNIFGKDEESELIDGLAFIPSELKASGYLNEKNQPISNTDNKLGKKNHQWTNSKSPSGEFVIDGRGRPIFDGETGFIANILVALSTKSLNDSSPYHGQTLFETFMSGDTTNALGYLESDFSISKVFAAIDHSAVFSAKFGVVLDGFLSEDPNLGLIDKEQNQTFASIKDWSKEGTRFAHICDNIKETGIKLSELKFTDIQKENVANLNVMLHNLADSGLFGTEDGAKRFSFNSFLYNKLKGELQGSEPNVLADPYPINGEITYDVSMKHFGVKVSGDKIITDLTSKEASKQLWCNKDWMPYSDYTNEQLKSISIDDPNFYGMDYISYICKMIYQLLDLREKTGTEALIPDFKQCLNDGTIKSNDLESLLTTLNDIEPLRIVLYNSINNVKDIVILPGQEGKTKDVTLKEMNAYFFIDDAYSREDRQIEIEHFIDLYDKINLYIDRKNGFVPEEFITDPLNILRLKDLITSINDSYILHKSGKAQYVESYKVIEAGKEVVKEKLSTYSHTAFQTILSNFILQDAIANFFYNPTFEKDKNLISEYDSLQAKKDLYLEKIFPVTSDEAKVVLQHNEIGKELEILSSLVGGYRDLNTVELKETINENGELTSAEALRKKVDAGGEIITYPLIKEVDSNKHVVNIDDFYQGITNGGKVTVDPTNMDYKDVTGEGIKSIIEAFNESDLLYDCAPNILQHILHNFNTGAVASEDDIFVRALKDSDPCYIYRLDDPLNPNFEKRYPIKGKDGTRKDAFELDYIAEIIDNYLSLTNDGKTFKDLFNEFKTNQAIIDSDIKPILYNLKNCYMFHKQVATNNKDLTRKLTSFEDVISGIYTSTNIVSDDPSTRMIDKSVDELNTLIKKISNVDLGAPKVGFSNNWNEEIDSIFDFAIEVSQYTETGSMADVKLDINDPRFNPDAIASILYKLNNIDTCEGSVGHMIKTVFTDTEFNIYSTLDGHDRANYKLTQAQFGENPASHGEIDNIYNLLNSLSHKEINPTTHELEHKYYFKFESVPGVDPIDSLVTNMGGSIEPLLTFLDNSLIYDSSYVLNDLGFETPVKTKAIFFYNMMNNNSLGNFISGNTSNDKLRVINRLMVDLTDGKGERAYAPAYEANGINNLIKEAKFLTTVSSFDPSNIESVKAAGETVKNLISGLVDDSGNRAYLSSEIMSNIMQEFLDSQIYDASNNLKIMKPESIRYFRATDASGKIAANTYDKIQYDSYNLLSKNEANGFKAIVDLYKGLDYHAYVGHINGSAFTNAVYVENGKQRNAYIASAIYMSDIYYAFDNGTPECIFGKAEQIYSSPMGSIFEQAMGHLPLPRLQQTDLFIYDEVNGVSLITHGDAIGNYINKFVEVAPGFGI